jgi:hypothetical protein
LVLGEPDAIVALGALAAAELYDVAVPIVATPAWDDLVDGRVVTVTAGAPGEAATIAPS